jgi:hypothetical protein
VESGDTGVFHNDDALPFAYEAGPLPGGANGGRCCPHTDFPDSETIFRTRAALIRLKRIQAACSGLANRSVDEPANPDVHHQTYRQENKQCGGASVAHQRQRNAGDRHSANHHSHIY